MNVRVDLNFPIKDGTEIVFKAPCDYAEVTGLTVYYPVDGVVESHTFAFADANVNDLADFDALFAKDAVVKVILDLRTNMAFVQNADTNAYLEGRFAQMGSLDGLDTDNKENLVAAINEAMTKGNGLPGKDGRGIASVMGNEDGSWTFTYDDGSVETVSNEAYMAMTERMEQLAIDVAEKEQLTPEFANDISECADTGKLYVLPDGYIYAYMATIEYPYTNQIPLSIDADKTPYNGGKGWKSDYRLNSSGVEVEASGDGVTGYIPINDGDTIYFENYPVGYGVGTGYLSLYDSSFSHIASIQVQNTSFDDLSNHYYLSAGTTDEETGYLTSVTIGGKYSSEVAYIRLSADGLDGSAIVAVNEEITGEGVATYAWMNTGHAFVPADYEDRILELEETTEANAAELATQKKQIEALGSGSDALIPDYVIEEADAVMERVIAAQGDRTFTFAAITDMHYGVWSYKDGITHACQAVKYISERIELDAVAVLGDYTDGYPDSEYDNAIADFQAVNSALDGLRSVPNLRLAGNHDIYNENPALTMRYINAFSDDVVWGSRACGYYYRDFDGYKLRVIGLNTNVADIGQYEWFVSALDLSDKADVKDWSILVLSHHPLDWYPADDTYRYCYILDGYKNGTSGTAGDIAYDFTGGKNLAKLIGNIHGHIHNFKVDNIYLGNVNSGEKTDVIRVATPNACYNRENEYEGAWAEDTKYEKTKDSAKDTSFCIYCIDLDACTIKAICYGAGIDREIDYSYTNDVEAPEVKVMDSETWTFTLEDGSTVTKQVVVLV